MYRYYLIWEEYDSDSVGGTTKHVEGSDDLEYLESRLAHKKENPRGLEAFITVFIK